jgi:hypothetical protein
MEASQVDLREQAKLRCPGSWMRSWVIVRSTRSEGTHRSSLCNATDGDGAMQQQSTWSQSYGVSAVACQCKVNRREGAVQIRGCGVHWERHRRWMQAKEIPHSAMATQSTARGVRPSMAIPLHCCNRTQSSRAQTAHTSAQADGHHRRA